jgi:hypothetical protein
MDEGMKERRFLSCFNVKETEEGNDAKTIRDEEENRTKKGWK